MEAHGQTGVREKASACVCSLNESELVRSRVVLNLKDACLHLQDSSGEARSARLGPPVPQRHLHGDRLAGEHDATHPIPQERGGASEEEPALSRTSA